MSGEEYRRAMDTLARETTMPPESAARIERQLLDALATRDAAAVNPSAPVNTVGWHLRSTRTPIIVSWRPWVSAAAAILLVASCVAYLWWAGQPRVNVGQQATPPAAAERPPAVPLTVSPTIDRSPALEIATAHSASRIKRPTKTNVVTPSGFVDLPWTAGLPTFESGEIVRMDIPVASLPTYGIDISAGPGTGPVEADVLIGQDGFARAIRLVASSSRSTQ
jgi:hypothetical protein